MTEAFEIRRRTSVYAGVGAAAAVLAVLLGVRAFTADEPFVWLVVVVLAIIAYAHLIAAVDSRTPLFVADDQGVRLRSGQAWVGFRWSEMGDIKVIPRQGIRSDARVKVLSGDGTRIYTAPLGFATSSSAAEAEVQLARRRSAAAY